MANWIIGISGSEMDNVIAYRVSGTATQVKQHLVNKVKADRKMNRIEGYAEWDNGTIKASEVEERANGTLYAYADYDAFHYDYTATPEMPVKVLRTSEKAGESA